MSTPPVDETYFDSLYADGSDPWGFRSRWYERRKRALTLAVLPHARYGRALEAGCANGELAADLAPRCDRQLACDFLERAAMLATRRLRSQATYGANYLLEAGVRWLAFTDADTQVSPERLAAQLSLGADAVCGSIAIGDWNEHTQEIRARFEAHYRDVDGHRHIHGANLGMTREAYIGAGGFPPLTVSEDVALVEALSAGGWHIAWSSAPRVMTSARSHARANGGFASFLMSLYGNGTVPIDGSDTEATISGIDPRALDIDIPITFQA